MMKNEKNKKNDAIQVILTSDRHEEVCRAIIFIVDIYWENNREGTALQNIYNKLKNKNRDRTELFEWIVSHCTVWSLGLGKNYFKPNILNEEVFKKAIDNWNHLKENVLGAGEYGIFESYRNHPLSDLSKYRIQRAETAYEKKDYAKLILEKAKGFIDESKSAKSATKASIEVIDAYIENPTSMYLVLLSDLYNYMKSCYESPIHEQFYRLLVNVTDWDVFKNCQDFTRSDNNNTWVKERKKLRSNKHGVADYNAGFKLKETASRKSFSIKSIIGQMEDVESKISSSYFMTLVRASDYELDQILKKSEQITFLVSNAKEYKKNNTGL